jgi:microcin C transport system permease protein
MSPETAPPAENTVGVVAAPPPISRGSVSVFRRRLRKFRTLKRGYYSFLILATAYLVSFALPLFINNKALIVHYDGKYYFPIFQYHGVSDFGMQGFGEPNYRELKKKLADDKAGNWALLPLYPYSPTESLLDLPGTPPNAPSRDHIFGTDSTGRDVFARLAYGFNVSMTFAVLVLIFAYGFGIIVGATLGYFGSVVDITGQRLIEIWAALPFLYTIIIISSIIVPVYTPGRNLLFQQSFWLLIGILALFDWVNITYYVRGEFYREKAKDYIGAAIAMGVSEVKIMFKHILPNALTPVVSFAPFAIVANISSLVALDFLGFGLPAPTPSWGELIGEGLSNLTSWWLVLFPIGALFLTLLLIVLIGESVRDSFDPKDYSRLR